jgi:hypothetical protein
VIDVVPPIVAAPTSLLRGLRFGDESTVAERGGLKEGITGLEGEEKGEVLGELDSPIG